MGCDSITPAEAVQLMNNPVRPDARREGIAALATRWSFGKLPPYPEIYKHIAQHDSDSTVRAMAIRALNICRDPSATKIFIEGLNDDNDLVRLESAKALANIPDPEAIPRLTEVLTERKRVMTEYGMANAITQQSKDVRIAAADALRRYHDNLGVKRTLVDNLGETDFGVAWQCRQSLIALTGQDLGYSETAWLQYLAKG